MGCVASNSEKKKNDTKGINLPPEENIETITSKENITTIYREGSFGTVRKATSKSTKKIYAVKTIDKKKIKKNFNMFKRELSILRKLDHPNVIKFYETYEDEKYFHLVMEFCSGGELLERIANDHEILSEAEIRKIMKSIFQAVNYLHERQICHRDLKPENFLYSDRTPDAEIKIIDFGLSIQFQLSDNNPTIMKTIVGSPLYVAPEVLKGKYDQKCDMWSLGVMLFILLSGHPPFRARNNTELFEKIEKGKFSMNGKEWKNVSKNVQQLISRLIVVDEALNHNWFKMNLDQSVVKQPELKVDNNVINLLKNFRGLKKFEKEAYKILINQMNEKEIKNLKEAFQNCDKDNTGKISFQELKQIMMENGDNSTEEELRRIMKTCDIEGNEYIYYSEFIAATLDKKFHLTKEKLYSTFQYFDVDNSGYITVENLQKIMTRAGKNIPYKELEEMIKENDKVGDNKISFDEFVNMMTKEEGDLDYHATDTVYDSFHEKG